MNKMVHYLKPYTVLIISCALLLYLQANMELALPGYMSDIVNVGIQQSGIEHGVPEIIRKETFDKIIPYLSPKSRETIDRYYTLNEADNLYQLKENHEINEKTFSYDIGKGFMMFHGVKNSVTIDTAAAIQSAIHAIREEYRALDIDISKKQSSYIFKTGLIMIVFTLISAFAAIFAGFFAAKTSAGLAKNLRSAVFTKVENFSGAEFDTFSTASLITRATNDITQIQTVTYMTLKMLLYAPIIGVGGVIKAVDRAPSMAWLIGLTLFLLLLLIVTVMKIATPKFKLIQTLVDKLNLISRERLTGLLVVRAFNRQKAQEQRFDNANKELTRTNLFVQRVMVFLMPILMLVMNMLAVLIVWIGAKEVAASRMMIGDMMAFMQYSMQIVMAFFMITGIFIFIPRASVSAARIFEVLNTKPIITDPVNPGHLPGTNRGLVEFKNVVFRYPGAMEDVLKNISFTAEPGKMTAIIGATGSGKSTLVNLIPRFYEVTHGEILIDTINIKNITQKELRSNIGYVPQKTSIFSGTIESNLKYANSEADTNTLIQAAKTAQAMEFISAKEETFKTVISQGGSNISGGQKQRLSIARALVNEYPVYIFDDTFSALDLKTDAKIRRSLKEKTVNSTVIIITQRVATVLQADQIIVLDKGEIVGKGTHNELMAVCEEYKEIALSQLEMKELL